MMYLSLNSKVEVKIHVYFISMSYSKIMKASFPKSYIEKRKRKENKAQ